MTDFQNEEDMSPPRSQAPILDDELVRIVDTLPQPKDFTRRLIDAVPAAESVQSYLEVISKTPSLSEADELALVEKVKGGKNVIARKKLIEANLRLVAWIAKEYAAGDVTLSDLINDGTLGLLEAVDSFEPAEGKPFRLFASSWIRQSISRAVAQETLLNRIPEYLLEKINSIKPASLRLMQELSREPTRDEVAKELGLSREDLDRLVTLVGHAPGNEENKPEEEEIDDDLREEDPYEG